MRLLFSILAIMLFSCTKDDLPNPTKAEKNIAILISPKTIDSKYNSSDQNHYVVRNTKTHVNKLLLFIGGSYSIPGDYNIFCQHAASIGLDVISLSYPNGVATAPLGVSGDFNIFDNYRQELCFGTPISSVVSVDSLNSIFTRTVKLIQHLDINYPHQNWGQYLDANNSMIWSKIIVAGHSQGSGHACYLSKYHPVNRVVMFSGPNDYSSYYGISANWLRQMGVTEIGKYYALLHVQDEIVPFNNQVINLRGLGLLGADQDPTLVDNLTMPYLNAHALSINPPAISFHSSTVGANSKLPNIWTYMLMSN